MTQHYDNFNDLLSRSSAVKLLRARHAPLILGFLYQEFKEKQRLIISNQDLVYNLTDWLEALGFADDDDPEAPVDADRFSSLSGYAEKARRYIDDWCSEENRYLRKFPDEKRFSVHELTPGSEKALQWVQSLEKKSFVGTESRFRDIFEKLQKLIEQSTSDPEQRIAELEAQKSQIDAQIRKIRADGRAEIFSDTEIKERFYEINRLGRDLIADFKEVDENFKVISRKIYERQVQGEASKGDIVGYALDATDTLAESDQGKSFYAFWHFLQSAPLQEKLKGLVKQLFDILDGWEIPQEDDFLRNIKINLHNAGKKVVDSNHRMAERLNLVLSESSQQERQKTLSLIAEIRKRAGALMDHGPDRGDFIEIEDGCEFQMVMDRPLGRKPQKASFQRQPNAVGGENLEEADLADLFRQFEIDRDKLEKNIMELLDGQKQVTLEAVLQRYPITRGLTEIIAYLFIASASPKHYFQEDQTVRIQLFEDNIPGRAIEMPRVIYTR